MPWGSGLSQPVSYERDGTDPRPLAQLAPISALSWTSALPGGDATLTATLALPAAQQPPALRPGRLLKVFRGAESVWDGTLAAPVRASGSWTLAANGIGTYGNSYVADWDGVNFGLQQIINRARGDPRRLLWETPGDLNTGYGLDLSQQFDSCSKSITDAINGFCSGAGKTWEITRRQHLLRIFPMPDLTRPTRLLIAPDPPGRTLAGYYDTLYLRHQVTADGGAAGAATYANVHIHVIPAINRFGSLEGYGDWSQAGIVDDTKAEGWARGVLSAYQSASYTTAFAVTPGQVLTLGGTPVDLGTERAGEVYKVLYADGGFAGEPAQTQQVTFLGGEYQWDDIAQAASISPYQIAAASLSGLLQSMQPAPPPAPAAK